MILHKTLTNLGIHLDRPDDITDAKVASTLAEVLRIYDHCLLDHELVRSAYGITVAATAIALNCTIRTAALLVEHALELRKLKYDRRTNWQHINQPRTNSGHSNVDRSGPGGQTGDSKSPDDGICGPTTAVT